jgi:hypothetical protein
MRYVVLSVDYEIFGNGTGDVRQHIIRPAEMMGKVFDDHGVPLTVFFEAEEYVSFKKYSQALTKDLGYDPARLIEDQAISLLQRGHDIQLHLHPQWYGARYSDQKWQLRPEKTTVDSLFETEAQTTNYIGERKALLDDIISRVNLTRKVRSYRAGAFSAQPGRNLLAALANNGFVLDTSVVKGLQSASDGFNYRNAPCAKGPWRIREEAASEDPSGPLWEFPIYSIMGRRYNQLTPSRLRAKFSSNVPKDKQKEMVAQLGIRPSNPFGLLKFLWQAVPIKLDYHNVSPARLMRWIRFAPKTSEDHPDVVMLIGHTKEHIDNRPLDALLRMIVREPDMKIISLDTLANMLTPKVEMAAVL